MSGDDYGRLIYLGLLLVAVSGWVIVEYHQRMGQALRVALAWGMIFVGLMAGYGLWSDLQRDVLPHQLVGEAGEVMVVIPRAQDGHYYLRLAVNGRQLLFMVDTGATNVVLSHQDAKRLEIDPAGLDFIGQAMTANGMVRTARVKLALLELGPFRDEHVTAWVNETAMGVSLLGMDYLGLFAIEIAADRMILRR